MEAHFILVSFRGEAEQPVTADVVSSSHVHFLPVHIEFPAAIVRVFLGGDFPHAIIQGGLITDLPMLLKTDIHAVERMVSYSVRPPKSRILQGNFPEGYFFFLKRRQGDRLPQDVPISFQNQGSGLGGRRDVLHLYRGSQHSIFLTAVTGFSHSRHLSHYIGRLHLHRSGGGDGNLVPNACVAVSHRLYPIPSGRELHGVVPGNHTIASLSSIRISGIDRRVNNDCQYVQGVCPEYFCDVETTAEEHALTGLFVDTVTVQKDVSHVVDATEIQPHFPVLWQFLECESLGKPVGVEISTHRIDIRN